ncbi:MAG: hypothetical protein ACRDH5_09970, partial [bacterium]
MTEHTEDNKLGTECNRHHAVGIHLIWKIGLVKVDRRWIPELHDRARHAHRTNCAVSAGGRRHEVEVTQELIGRRRVDGGAP